MKRCSKCKIEKSADQFARCAFTKDGSQYRCKQCDQERYVKNHKAILKRARLFDKKRRETIRETNRECYRKNRAFLLEKRRKYRAAHPRAQRGRALERYGMTLEHFEQLEKWQLGLCAICEVRPIETLAVDHNHTTGKNRGLLCRACNCGIGNFRESCKVLKNAIDYLKKHEG